MDLNKASNLHSHKNQLPDTLLDGKFYQLVMANVILITLLHIVREG